MGGPEPFPLISPLGVLMRWEFDIASPKQSYFTIQPPIGNNRGGVKKVHGIRSSLEATDPVTAREIQHTIQDEFLNHPMSTEKLRNLKKTYRKLLFSEPGVSTSKASGTNKENGRSWQRKPTMAS